MSNLNISEEEVARAMLIKPHWTNPEWNEFWETLLEAHGEVLPLESHPPSSPIGDC